MNETFKHSEIIDLLNRYFTGEASVAYVGRIKTWINESTENKKFYDHYKSLWDNLEKYRISQIVDVNNEWNLFKAKLEKSKQVPKTIELKPKKQLGLFTKVLKIAAVIIMFLMLGSIGYYLFNQSGKEKYITKNDTREVRLPDQSKITLNRNSKIIVSKDYNKKRRVIKLVGEAYFEVEPDRKKPFIVKTSYVEIEALGTKFLVNSDKGKETIEVIVNSGIVSVTQISNRHNKVILNAGEKVTFRMKVQDLKKINNIDVNFLSWKTKKLIFKNDKLSKVVKTLNKIHQANIQIKDEKIKDCKLSASFVDQSLESILKVIENTLDIKVEKQGEIIMLTGDGC